MSPMPQWRTTLAKGAVARLEALCDPESQQCNASPEVTAKVRMYIESWVTPLVKAILDDGQPERVVLDNAAMDTSRRRNEVENRLAATIEKLNEGVDVLMGKYKALCAKRRNEISVETEDMTCPHCGVDFVGLQPLAADEPFLPEDYRIMRDIATATGLISRI